MADFGTVRDGLLTTLRGSASFDTANCDYLNEDVFVTTTNNLAVIVFPGPISPAQHLGFAAAAVPLALVYTFPTVCFIEFQNEEQLATDTETAIEQFIEQLQGDITIGESSNFFSAFQLVSYEGAEVRNLPWLALNWEIAITAHQT